ncbi:hypothetical protein SSPO_008910 [Streptomyces antimycoticus]|uniref:Uncharacterized protein n=1 Tax=Streptomyces antimycoticus TaxID=68175 RepID=A0A499UBE5_9ACTN|nr:hypothetical protein [Streptomyces antimycoticus]BBJ38173.1 hypothetical protein SSPO_008910 [Streptomyces antimycoticus]
MATTPVTEQNEPSTPPGAPATERERKRLHTKLKLATQIGQGIDGYIIGGIGLAMGRSLTTSSCPPWNRGWSAPHR